MDESVDASFENKKRKKHSGSNKSTAKKCERNGSSEADTLTEMEFIDSAIKATKALKKSKKEQKKKKQ